MFGVGMKVTYAVPEPIGGRGESDTTGAHGQRIDFTNHDPGTRTPGGGEEKDVDTDEGDHGLDGIGILAVHGSGNGDDELADDHTEGTPDQERTTTEALNGPEGNGGRAHVDEGGNKGDEEGILDRTQGLEEGGSEVEDEVDAGPLLHHLHGSTEDGPSKIAAGLGKTAFETSGPTAPVSIGRHHLHLVFVIGDNFRQFVLDVVGRHRLAAQSRQTSRGLVELTLADEITGRFGKQEQAGSKDESPCHLDGDGNAVRAGVITILGGVVDARGQEDTNGDTELVARHDRATDLARGDFGHVQNDNGGDEADTETSDQATGDQETNDGRSSLEDDTNDEDGAARDDGRSTTEPVRQITGDERTEEGSGRQDRGDEGLLGRGQGEGCRIVLDVLGVGVEAGVELDEVGHAHDTADISRVVAEENTAKGGKGAHHVTLGIDGSFELLGFGGCCNFFASDGDGGAPDGVVVHVFLSHFVG